MARQAQNLYDNDSMCWLKSILPQTSHSLAAVQRAGVVDLELKGFGLKVRDEMRVVER